MNLIAKKNITTSLIGFLVPVVFVLGSSIFSGNSSEAVILHYPWETAIPLCIYMYMSLFFLYSLFFLKERFLTHFVLFLGGTVVAIFLIYLWILIN